MAKDKSTRSPSLSSQDSTRSRRVDYAALSGVQRKATPQLTSKTTSKSSSSSSGGRGGGRGGGSKTISKTTSKSSSSSSGGGGGSGGSKSSSSRTIEENANLMVDEIMSSLQRKRRREEVEDEDSEEGGDDDDDLASSRHTKATRGLNVHKSALRSAFAKIKPLSTLDWNNVAIEYQRITKEPDLRLGVNLKKYWRGKCIQNMRVLTGNPGTFEHQCQKLQMEVDRDAEIGQLGVVVEGDNEYDDEEENYDPNASRLSRIIATTARDALNDSHNKTKNSRHNPSGRTTMSTMLKETLGTLNKSADRDSEQEQQQQKQQQEQSMMSLFLQMQAQQQQQQQMQAQQQQQFLLMLLMSGMSQGSRSSALNHMSSGMSNGNLFNDLNHMSSGMNSGSGRSVLQTVPRLTETSRLVNSTSNRSPDNNNDDTYDKEETMENDVVYNDMASDNENTQESRELTFD